jgi:ABC-type transport system involved in cytochrome c biogenesis ATPase subunit
MSIRCRPDTVPSEDLRRKLRSLVDASTATQVAEQLGVYPSTLLRILAGLPVRRGSLLLAQVRVDNAYDEILAWADCKRRSNDDR